MKKAFYSLTSIVLAIMMLFSASFVAFAETSDLDEENEKIEDIAEVSASDTLVLESVVQSTDRPAVEINWTKVDNVSKYRVFYKRTDRDTSWRILLTTTETSCEDSGHVFGKKYEYSVRCLSEDESEYIGDYSNTIEFDFNSSQFPVLNEVTYADSVQGVNISWDEVEGVSYYRVYYKRIDRDNEWRKLTDTDKTSFVDTGHVYKKNYAYAVRCISSNGTTFFSDYSNVEMIRFEPNAPKMQAVSLCKASEGVDLSWTDDGGVEKYRVYYKRSDRDTEWRTLCDVKGKSCKDTGHIYQKEYQYSVRPLNSDGSVFIGDQSNTVSIKYAPQSPKLTGVNFTKGDEGVDITWDAVDGVSKYRVYYKRTDRDTEWRYLTDVSGTSTRDTGHMFGKTYVYCVRSISNNLSQFYSDYSNSMGIRYVFDAPVLTSVDFVANERATDITWNAVNGITNYEVYFKRTDRDTSWKKLGVTSTTSFRDTGHIYGKTYAYCVRCLDKSKSIVLSDYSNSKSINYSPMGFQKLENRNEGIYLSWNRVDNAQKYVIKYRRSNWTSYNELITLSANETSYQDFGAAGVKYYYIIQAFDSEGKALTAYDESGKEITLIKSAPISYCRVYDGEIYIVWDKVAGAASYNLYYRYADDEADDWRYFANTKGNTYNDYGVESGDSYYYVIKGVDENGVESQSYDKNGYLVQYLDTPQITRCEVESVNDEKKTGNVIITWDKVGGAKNYGVYYRREDWSSNTPWTKLAVTSDTEYHDTGCLSGQTYIYAIQCVDDTGERTTSWYDDEIISFSYDQLSLTSIKLIQKGNTGTVQLSWNKYHEASYYNIYYMRTDRDTNWIYLDTIKSTTYIDTGLGKNYTYKYTVAPANEIGCNMCLYGKRYKEFTYTGNEKIEQPTDLVNFLSRCGYDLDDLENRNCKQLICVESSSSNAIIKFYSKYYGLWVIDDYLTTSGFVGAQGTTSYMSEGVSATPKGLYSIGDAFYIYDKPTTSLNSFKITDKTYWIDDVDASDYNQRVESNYYRQGEHMIDYKSCYKYGFVINYNMNPVIPGAGSAIFFHINYRPTGGCVATSEDMVLAYLEELDADLNPYILIK